MSEATKEKPVTEPGTDMVAKDRATALALSKENLPPMAGSREWHNFDGTPRNRWRLKALCQSETQSADEVGGEIIPVKYWYVHEVQIFDSAKEEYFSAYRCCLVRPDLSAVSFVSAGVLKSLISMTEAIGNGPYKEGECNVIVKKIKTRNGHTYNLIPAE